MKEQGRDLKKKYKNFKYDFYAAIILIVILSIYYLTKN